MRCTNCGWGNPDQNTKCEKCGALLEGSSEKDNPTIGEPIKPFEWPKPSETDSLSTLRETLREDQAYPKETVNETVNETRPEQATSDTSAYPKTINPWEMGPTPYPMMFYCKLTPLPLAPNERHLPRVVEMKGEYNELNRGNLDPDNSLISQNIQAVLTCKNGKWYIKDQSPYKTTYILASEEVPLKDGDVILMGNRRFVFTEE